MKVLVLGGTRYFGKLIVEELLAAGHGVTIFTRGNRPSPFDARLMHIVGDRREADVFRQLFRRREFDAVIDNIGYRPEEVSISLDVFRGRVGTYLFTSTSAVYLDQHLSTPALKEEDCRFASSSQTFDGETYVYAISKMRCEELIREAVSYSHVILRPPVVVGPEDSALRVYFFIQRIQDGGPVLLPQLPQLKLHHVYSRDVARVYVRALEKPSSWNRTYNVAAREVLTAGQYLGFIAKRVGRELKLAYAPSSALQSMGYKQPFVFNQVLSTARLETEALSDLTGFDVFMEKTVDWFLTAYKGPHSMGYDRRQEELEFAGRMALCN